MKRQGKREKRKKTWKKAKGISEKEKKKKVKQRFTKK
jgi:hypothetical protein